MPPFTPRTDFEAAVLDKLEDGANGSATSAVAYVAASGSDDNDGSTWAKAFATLAAASASVGPQGTIYVGQGTFPITSMVTVDRLGSIEGQGPDRTIFENRFNGTAIMLTDLGQYTGPTTAPNTKNRAGRGLQNFTVIAGTGSGNSSIGIMLRDIVFPQLINIAARGFIGSSARAIVFQNFASGIPGCFIERARLESVVVENSTIGILCEKVNGDVSQAYANWINVHVNVQAVAPGGNAQTGVRVNGVNLYQSYINVQFNVTGVNGANTVAPTAMHLEAGGMMNCLFDVRGEGSATSTSLRMENSGVLFATGVLSFHYSDYFLAVINSANMKFAGLLVGNGLIPMPYNTTTHPALTAFSNNNAAIDILSTSKTVGPTNAQFRFKRETNRVYAISTFDGTTETTVAALRQDATVPYFHAPQGIRLNAGGKQYSGSGAPNIPTSASGDYYFRTDTPTVANQRIYIATGANTWTGIV